MNNVQWVLVLPPGNTSYYLFFLSSYIYGRGLSLHFLFLSPIQCCIPTDERNLEKTVVRLISHVPLWDNLKSLGLLCCFYMNQKGGHQLP